MAIDGGPRTRSATAAGDGVPNAEAGNKAEGERAEEHKDRQHGAATFRTNKRSRLQLSKCYVLLGHDRRQPVAG